MIKSVLFLSLFFTFNLSSLFAQTSWIGVTDNKWSKSYNWTAGVPDQNTNAIIGDSNFTVQLFWENAAESGITAYTSDLVVAHWNGSAWENAGQSAITTSNPGNVTSNTVSSFSPFTFGSLSPGVNSLPIELLDFAAKLKNEVVELKWETTTEINNDYFTIEKSTDGVNFKEVEKIKGAGNSSINIAYKSYDTNPFDGVSKTNRL